MALFALFSLSGSLWADELEKTQVLPRAEQRTFDSALAIRRPNVPLAALGPGLTNPVDRLLQPYFAAHGVTIPDPVADRAFARRVHLDLVGLLPSPEDFDRFERDPRPDRRGRLVRTLLDNRQAYAEHWLTFWNDALRNDYQGTGFIDGGRQQITAWLYRALYENRPYNRFVHELLSPVSGSEGFVRGIQWRGVVNASQRPEMQAAQNLSQVFLGTNLKCASCHDSFVNHWRLADAYSLASVFADQPLEIHHCDRATGKTSEVRCIFPELGRIDPKAPKHHRMRQLADALTGPQNGRLARTIVNRLWAALFGRGIVEPLDDMDQAAFSQYLLDWLAADLVDHGYDLKRTLQLMATSRAYQSPSVGAPRPDQQEFVFRGPLVKRMTAEQFEDAVSTLTGAWYEVTPAMLQGGGGGPGGQLAAVKATRGDMGPIRASLIAANPLLRALGRPNREQVVTRRDSIATTLEALELTNGPTLDGILRRGADHWLKRQEGAGGELPKRIYLTALGRPPQEAELAAARSLIGDRPTKDGVCDLLWSVIMLPEFQLIY